MSNLIKLPVYTATQESKRETGELLIPSHHIVDVMQAVNVPNHAVSAFQYLDPESYSVITTIGHVRFIVQKNYKELARIVWPHYEVQ